MIVYFGLFKVEGLHLGGPFVLSFLVQEILECGLHFLEIRNFFMRFWLKGILRFALIPAPIPLIVLAFDHFLGFLIYSLLYL